MRVSVLVPYTPNSKRDPRIAAWEWIRKRWEIILPGAEIVEGADHGRPFSKTVAVNDAYTRARGDMFIIADADSWVERDALEEGLAMAARQERLVMPWTMSYRFSREHSKEILSWHPHAPLQITPAMRKVGSEDAPSPASAAMVIILQRSAFERVGGMDPRFRGWGSEDVSFSLACWTLLGRNAFILGEAYALYHPRPVNEGRMRVWDDDPGSLNFPLWHRYRHAQGRVHEMTRLCREHALPGHEVSPSPYLSPDDMVLLPDPNDGPDLNAAPIANEQQGSLTDGERITV